MSVKGHKSYPKGCAETTLTG